MLAANVNIKFPVLSHEQQTKLAYLCIGVLTLVLSWQCAGIPERFSLPELPAVKHHTTLGVFAHPLPDLSEDHLFGEYAGDEAVEAQETQHLRITGIDMTGTKHAYVILDDDSKQGIYHVGDTLQSGATIQRIEKNHIVLEHAGRTSTLKFEEDILDTNQRWDGTA